MFSKTESPAQIESGGQSVVDPAQQSGATNETCETDVDAEPDAADTDTSLSLDVAFDIVKNERRRLVLQYLEDKDGAATLGELAEHIAAIENNKDVKAINSTERKRVYVGLYQCHLPKMEAADIIDSERNSKITLGENADEVIQYVGENEKMMRPWHRYYLTLAVVGTLGIGVSVGAGVATVTMPFAGVVILTLLAVAVVHNTQSEQ